MTWGEGLNWDGLRCPTSAMAVSVLSEMQNKSNCLPATSRTRATRTSRWLDGCRRWRTWAKWSHSYFHQAADCETNVSSIPLCSHSCWQLTCDIDVVFSAQQFVVAMRQLRYSSAGFEGCVTQGCDEESFETAKDLALSHPLLLGVCVCLGVMEWFPWFIMIQVSYCILLCVSFCRDSFCTAAWKRYRLNMATVQPKGWQLHRLIQLQWWSWRLGFHSLQPPLWTMGSFVGSTHQGYMHPLAVIRRHLARGTCYLLLQLLAAGGSGSSFVFFRSSPAPTVTAVMQAAWSYNDDFEASMLAYMDACGRLVHCYSSSEGYSQNSRLAA